MVGNVLATISCQLNAVGIGRVVGNPSLMTKNHQVRYNIWVRG